MYIIYIISFFKWVRLFWEFLNQVSNIFLEPLHKWLIILMMTICVSGINIDFGNHWSNNRTSYHAQNSYHTSIWFDQLIILFMRMIIWYAWKQSIGFIHCKKPFLKLLKNCCMNNMQFLKRLWIIRQPTTSIRMVKSKHPRHSFFKRIYKNWKVSLPNTLYKQ